MENLDFDNFLKDNNIPETTKDSKEGKIGDRKKSENIKNVPKKIKVQQKPAENTLTSLEEEMELEMQAINQNIEKQANKQKKVNSDAVKKMLETEKSEKEKKIQITEKTLEKREIKKPQQEIKTRKEEVAKKTEPTVKAKPIVEEKKEESDSKKTAEEKYKQMLAENEKMQDEKEETSIDKNFIDVSTIKDKIIEEGKEKNVSDINVSEAIVLEEIESRNEEYMTIYYILNNNTNNPEFLDEDVLAISKKEEELREMKLKKEEDMNFDLEALVDDEEIKVDLTEIMKEIN